MRIGILGGTFNPVHSGHLRIAEEAREAISLDKIIFIPCYIPPHKDEEGMASADARMHMLELAVRDNPFFETSDMELKRGGKSYSIETLTRLRDDYGESAQLLFIIGMDSYREIGIWKNYAELFYIADFAVVRRPLASDEKKELSPVKLLPVDIRDEFCYDPHKRIAAHRSGRLTYFLETTMLDISSTRLRDCLARGRSVKYLMPAEVEEFIKEKVIYKHIR
ncbi:MAG: nicotinate-nucleotide adenylyltransferase [bacterium]|nr:nicotinate-nucleotide adenylyltransferase [bacterium]